MRQVLADAFLRGGQNASIITYPGRKLDFRGGHTRIVDERDMPILLRMPNIILEISPERVDWLPQWMQMCGEINPPRADVRLPQGVSIGPYPEYKLIRAEAVISQPTVEPRDVMTKKTGWTPVLIG